jgi:hypothetical protein
MGYDIHVLLGDSQDPEIIDRVKALGPYDCALLDGDHRYQGIKTDFEAYAPLCGEVALHDIVGEGQRHSEGVHVEVPRFWQEIRTPNSVEYVAEGSKMGIGVYVP